MCLDATQVGRFFAKPFATRYNPAAIKGGPWWAKNFVRDESPHNVNPATNR
jgi:hypothetical protein